MSKIYLASRMGRRDQMREVRAQLQAMGHTVTSQWIDTEFDLTGGGSSVAPPDQRLKYCLIDMEDVLRADWVISFTEDPDSSAGKRGGRHVEFGIALAEGKRLILVGPRENIFHHHPRVELFTHTEDMIDFLRTEQALRERG
jgi:hypothetical protein